MTELRGSATPTASSSYDASFTPDKALDGNVGTQWMANGGGITSWFQLDWGSPVTIREIRLINATSSGPGNFTFPRFTFSDASTSDGFPRLDVGNDITYVLLQPKTTTSLRISIVNWGQTTDYVGFNEVYVNDAYTVDPTTDLTKPDHLVESSHYVANYAPYAIDANATSEWISNNEGVNAYLRFDYNHTVQIEEVQLRSSSAADESWGKPRFRYSDNTYEDGADVVSESGMTTYTLTPKLTTSLKIETWASYDNYPALANVIITGEVNPTTPAGARISATGIQIIG